MRMAKEETSCSAVQVMDLISAVKELHVLNSQELNKLLRDSDNFVIDYLSVEGSSIKVDMEKLAGCLPLHLIAVLMSAERDEVMFRYLLSGLRLLHSLCEARHAKLEQILLDDVKVSEQMLDLVIYLLIVLSGYKQQGNNDPSPLPLLHSALVACGLHLLTGFISSQWQDLAHVLLAHPKIDVFMDVAFRAVCMMTRSLRTKLSPHSNDFCANLNLTAEQMVNYLCQQCEASLQFLHSLCQQKTFRERVLRNKELCGRGGVLILAQSIFNLEITPSLKQSAAVVAAISRLKAKMLSILLHLCEAESISYLDEVASCPQSLDLAKFVVLEVLNLLKTALGRNTEYSAAHSDRKYPSGLLQLNAMRLADIFSDDSNFRTYITTFFTEVLSAIFSLSHGDFLSSWCCSDLQVREEDASLDYDLHAATGWVLDAFSPSSTSNKLNIEYAFIPNNIRQPSYAHQRTSLFVKIIANLHCFIPNICEEQERNHFLHKFLECLKVDTDSSKPSPESSYTSDAPRADTVFRNLRSLLSHAESLIPTFLNEEDVQLLRVFFSQLQPLITPNMVEENGVQESKVDGSRSWDKFAQVNMSDKYQEAPSVGRRLYPMPRKDSPNLNGRSGNLREGMSENSTFNDLERLHVRSKHDERSNFLRRGRGEHAKFGGTASRVSREADGDVQNVETSGSDTSSMKGRNSADPTENGDLAQLGKQVTVSGSGAGQEDEKVETHHSEEKQRRKRKRTIMNEKQMKLMEGALLHEPEMQRNAVLIQTWADKLSSYGSEVTSSQLKNWLNNRKARLARAAKDVRAQPEVDEAMPDKQAEQGQALQPESPESPSNEVPSTSKGNTWSASRNSAEKSGAAQSEAVNPSPAELALEPGQHVAVVDAQGDEIGEGSVHQVYGKWNGRILEESKTCVVNITELKVQKWSQLPYPSETTGNSFEEAEAKIGVMRVLWDLNKISPVRPL